MVKNSNMLVEQINTTNDWGFGGWSGTRYTHPSGLVLEVGTYYYRHARPSPHWRFIYNGKRVRIHSKCGWQPVTEKSELKKTGAEVQVYKDSSGEYFGFVGQGDNFIGVTGFPELLQKVGEIPIPDEFLK